MTLGETAAGIANAARERASGQAVLVVVGPDDVIHLDQGADPLTESTRFDVGSITKTFTALLLAQMAVEGDLDLEASAAGEMTYVQLATHTSGLPRLPANLMPKAMASPDDPYRDYTAEDLEAAIDDVTVTPGDVLYSNLGYMVLAWALARAGGRSFADLLRDRVLDPLALTDTELGWEAATERVPGYIANEPVPDWTQQVGGDGGITSTITDVRTYLRAQLHPERTPLEEAIRLTQAGHATEGIPLGWQRQGSILWHNGGSGGFGVFCGFDPSSARASAILTNRLHSGATDQAAFRTLA